ncbi:T9SS type A sorting domain-containing protein [Bacteroidales bacterium OttesenSCG-928-B11]|nr:T9SS type A sorting domain-containing protein [Bacteroidales bacterium OttesenSCG-928-E04]MDL2309108.1 T9SS type A sorting domain-containing protein [Bacteroidales bacterium OttesenSCG-928-C03]MDL2312941.1 T9SS type A sorting domain-containing protein [Bacteroidales bacterium OttesenSCG-928-B11]MDL2326671.1 T9SS type A sorting domain-containing protein [Bacteroidales bacterium OttesenSCG-928-A14]
MKKVLLSAFIAFFALSAFAQYTPAKNFDPSASTTLKRTTLKGTEGNDSGEVMTSPVARATYSNFIGYTYYDLQTNGSLSNRMVAYPDGTVSMVYNVYNTTSATRGTGYNHYDGTGFTNSPMSFERIENVRAGWGTIGSLKDNGEIVVSHNGSTGLVVSTRETKGTGDWKSEILTGPSITGGASNTTSTCLLWPAIATVEDTIHLVACTESDTGYYYQGIQTCLLYYRGVYDRTTEKVTWSSPVIAGDITADKQKSFSGDSYSINANGNRVVILYAGTYSDIFYWLSEDCGRTWTKKVVFDTPVADGFKENLHVIDTTYVSDGSANVLVDDNGIVHVAFGVTRIFNEDITDGSITWWPTVSALVYWNSEMPAFTKEDDQVNALNPIHIKEEGYQVFDMLDLSGDGGIYVLSGGLETRITSYNVTSVSMPQMAWHDGTIYITYASELEYPFVNFDVSKMCRGIFAAKSDDNGTTWDNDKISWLSYGKNFWYVDWEVINDTTASPAPAIYNASEDVFPAIAIANGKVNFLWQSAYVPGSYIRENSTAAVCTTMVDLVWHQLDLDEVGEFNNIKSINNDDIGFTSHNSIKNVKIYPNPAQDNVTVVIETTDNSPATVTVTNLLGQTVYTEQININAGTNIYNINVNGFQNGFYMVNIKTTNGSNTQKLIVQ